MSERTKAAALAKVADLAAEYESTREAHTKARIAFHAAIVKARDEACTSTEIARVAGVTAARVTQIAPVSKAPRPRSHAQKAPVSPSRAKESPVVEPVTDTPATVREVHGPPFPPMIAPLPAASDDMGLSGLVSTRKLTRHGKVTVFLRDGFGVVVDRNGTTRNIWLGWPDDTNHVGYVLELIGRELPGERVVRVYLTGARPFNPTADVTMAEQVRAWGLAHAHPSGDGDRGWASESHYLSDPELPVLRFRHRDSQQSVTIMRAAAWWGESDADQATCAAAWKGLQAAVENVTN